MALAARAAGKGCTAIAMPDEVRAERLREPLLSIGSDDAKIRIVATPYRSGSISAKGLSDPVAARIRPSVPVPYLSRGLARRR